MTIPRRDFIKVGGAAVGGALLPRLVRADAPVFGDPDHAGLWSAWELSDEFVDALPALLARSGVPGISVALSDATGDVREVTAGHTSGSGTEPVGVDTVFAAGSLSKPVLATIAFRMHQAGDFDIDQPLAELLDADLPGGPGGERITTRHALQHTTGLPNWRFTLDTPFVTSAPPGGAWGYSGEGFVLVQRALESVTGLGLEGLGHEHVFGPMGMDSTTFLWRSDLAGRQAVPHVPETDRFYDFAVLFQWKERALVEWARAEGLSPGEITLDRARAADSAVSALAADLAGRSFPETAPVPNFLSPNGAGSLKTSAADYCRFVAAWLRDDDLHAIAFHQPVSRTPSIRWGLGWGMEASGSSFWHSGEALGVRTLAFGDPASAPNGGALVVLTNGNDGMRVIESVFAEAIGHRSPIFDVA